MEQAAEIDKLQPGPLGNCVQGIGDGAKAVGQGIGDGAKALSKGIGDGAKAAGDGVHEAADGISHGAQQASEAAEVVLGASACAVGGACAGAWRQSSSQKQDVRGSELPYTSDWAEQLRANCIVHGISDSAGTKIVGRFATFILAFHEGIPQLNEVPGVDEFPLSVGKELWAQAGAASGAVASVCFAGNMMGITEGDDPTRRVVSHSSALSRGAAAGATIGGLAFPVVGVIPALIIGGVSGLIANVCRRAVSGRSQWL